MADRRRGVLASVCVAGARLPARGRHPRLQEFRLRGDQQVPHHLVPVHVRDDRVRLQHRAAGRRDRICPDPSLHRHRQVRLPFWTFRGGDGGDRAVPRAGHAGYPAWLLDALGGSCRPQPARGSSLRLLPHRLTERARHSRDLLRARYDDALDGGDICRSRRVSRQLFLVDGCLRRAGRPSGHGRAARSVFGPRVRERRALLDPSRA